MKKGALGFIRTANKGIALAFKLQKLDAALGQSLTATLTQTRAEATQP